MLTFTESSSCRLQCLFQGFWGVNLDRRAGLGTTIQRKVDPFVNLVNTLHIAGVTMRQILCGSEYHRDTYVDFKSRWIMNFCHLSKS